MNMISFANSAKLIAGQNSQEQLIEIQRQIFEQQENLKHRQAIDTLSDNLNRQNITQTEMRNIISQIVKSQSDSNKIMINQFEELKKRNELLQKQNESQDKELKRQRIWNWITYGITTLIAVASVIGTFISAFR